MRSHRMLLPLLLVFLGVVEAYGSCNGTLSSCEESPAKYFFSAQGCRCFTCNEVNGAITYACKSPPSKTCSGSAQASTDVEDTNLNWTSKSYGLIVAVYIVVCAFAYGVVSLMARMFPSQVFQKEATACCDIIALITSNVRGFFIDPVLEDDGQTIRGFFEYFVTENELLNTFRLGGCCAKPKLANKYRPFLYRLSIVLAGILITISIGQLFGSIEFDDQACSVTIDTSYCTTCTCATLCNGINYGCNDDCTCKSNAQIGRSCPSRSCSSGVSTVDLSQTSSSTTNSCDSITLGNSFFSSTSILTTFLGQMLGFITSKMLETFIARSGPDLALHFFNMVFAAAWVAIAFGISAGMLQESPSKSAALRMKTISGITISTWLQGQVYALVQIPAFYIMRVVCYGCFSSSVPDEQAQEKQPKDPTGGAVVFPQQVEMAPIPTGKPSN